MDGYRDCLSWSWIGQSNYMHILQSMCVSLWNGVDRKSIGKLCAHYWQQVPHERHRHARLRIPIRNWIWIRNSRQRNVSRHLLSEQQVLFAESREKIIYNEIIVLYGVYNTYSILYYIYSKMKSVKLKARNCIENGLSGVDMLNVNERHLRAAFFFFLAWTWMRAIGIGFGIDRYDMYST